MKIGIVGATGLVGQSFCKLLESSPLPIDELRPFASQNSAGQQLKLRGNSWTIQALSANCFDGLDLVFFSSGDEISREWGPQAVASGAFAVDNSAAFRMSPEHKLIVPEVNGQLLPKKSDPAELIANPNCSTIQLVVALSAIQRKYELEGVRVATYQAASGAGTPGLNELVAQTKSLLEKSQNPEDLQRANVPGQAFAHQLAFNVLPHIGAFDADGFCSEERKIMSETQKILSRPQLPVSAFTVRVPAFNSHAEAVWVTLREEVTQTDLESTLRDAPGLEYVPQQNPQDYPHMQMSAGREPVFVGRLHQDVAFPRTWILWVVADNVLKGAALNGLQIAEQIFEV